MGVAANLSKYVYFLFTVILQVHVSSTALYTKYAIDGDQTCGMNGLVFQVASKSGIIFHENHDFDRYALSGEYPFNCSFSVDAFSHLGIIAVVQEINFRKDNDTGECIDYVQFRRSNSLQHNDEQSRGPKICGKIIAKKPEFTSLNIFDPSEEMLLPYAFIDYGGKIEVEIHVANVTRSPDTDLRFRIAFIAYYPCSDLLFDSRFVKCDPYVCIWSEYFHDNILNCPFTTCVDEGGCQINYEAVFGPSTRLAAKIVIGVLAGMLIMFIVFITFLWVSRRCSISWNSSTTHAQSAIQMRPVSIEEYVQPTELPRSPSMDKDLPPSYQSLFPNT